MSRIIPKEMAKPLPTESDPKRLSTSQTSNVGFFSK